MVHKFAFGELGWTPYEYYTSSPYEFKAASEGYFDKRDKDASLARVQTYFTVLAMGGKVRKPEELWTLFIDGVKEKINYELDADMYEKIKKAHGIN